jgi:exopolysaccharide production protein ExoQ
MSATLTLNPARPITAYAQEDDRFLFRRFRTWCLLVALFLLAEENGLFTRQDGRYWVFKGTQRYDSSPFLLLLTIVQWSICLGLMMGYIRPTLRAMFKQKAVLAFPILALLSVAWSAEPLLSLKKAILLSLLSLFAWFFSMYYSPGDQRRLLLCTGVIVALASIAMVLLLPQYGIAITGEWKGVFAQKNQLGLCMLFVFSGLPFTSIVNGRQRLKLFLLALLPVGLILLSQSRTALILCVVVLAVRIIGPLIVCSRKEQLPFMLFSLVVGAATVVFAATVGREMILSTLGRDVTLTGRTGHWIVLTTFARRHLWLGYGYQAFWTGRGDSLSMIEKVGAAMTGSDSGYVDILLEFGLVGLAMMLPILLVSIRDFRRLLRRPSVPLLAFWYGGVILALYVGCVTEGLFPVAGGPDTFMFIVACAALKTMSEEKPPALLNLGQRT